jgi:hypothetical protein
MINEPEFNINFYEQSMIDYLNEYYDITTIKKIVSYYIPVMIDVFDADDAVRQLYIPREKDREYIYNQHYRLVESENQAMLIIQRHYIKNKNKSSEFAIGLPIVDVCIANRKNKDNSEKKNEGGKKYNRKTRKNKQRSLKTKIN